MTTFRMSGDEMKAIRKGLGLSTIALGRALGYSGNDNTTSVLIRKYEAGNRPIPEWIGRLVCMFGRYGVPQVFSEDAAERDRSIEDLKQEERRLHQELRANDHQHVGKEYLDQQAKLFDFDWKARDPEGYAAHELHCNAIRARHRAGIAVAAALMDQIEDVMRLLKLAEAKRSAAF
jgi:transcriptional regulator with XRE-family HTH domain